MRDGSRRPSQQHAPMCQPPLTHITAANNPARPRRLSASRHSHIGTNPPARQTTTPATKPIPKPNTPPRPPMREPPLTHKAAAGNPSRPRRLSASRRSHIEAKPTRRRTATTGNKPLIRHPSQQHDPMCQQPLTHRHKPNSPANHNPSKQANPQTKHTTPPTNVPAVAYT